MTESASLRITEWAGVMLYALRLQPHHNGGDISADSATVYPVLDTNQHPNATNAAALRWIAAGSL